MPKVSTLIDGLLTESLTSSEFSSLRDYLGVESSPTEISDTTELLSLTSGVSIGSRYRLTNEANRVYKYLGHNSTYQAVVINSTTGSDLVENRLINDFFQFYGYENGRPKYVGFKYGEVIEYTGSVWEILSSSGDVMFTSTDDVGSPTFVTTWTLGVSGQGVLLQSEVSSSNTSVLSNWVDETNGRIKTPTNKSKQLLLNLKPDQEVVVTNEGDRVERFLGNVEFETGKEPLNMNVTINYISLVWSNVTLVHTDSLINEYSPNGSGWENVEEQYVLSVWHDGSKYILRDSGGLDSTVYHSEDIDAASHPSEVVTWTAANLTHSNESTLSGNLFTIASNEFVNENWVDVETSYTVSVENTYHSGSGVKVNGVLIPINTTVEDIFWSKGEVLTVENLDNIYFNNVGYLSRVDGKIVGDSKSSNYLPFTAPSGEYGDLFYIHTPEFKGIRNIKIKL